MTVAMRCSSCRVVVPNNLAACPHCGQRLTRPPAKPAKETAAPAPSAWERDLDGIFETTGRTPHSDPAPARTAGSERVRRIEAAQAEARRIVERAETEAA